MPPQWPWRKSLASLPSKTFPSGIKLMHEGENDVVDIIFIHGLTGDRERTWTAKNAPLPWIKTLLPLKIAHTRILTFGYDAYVADWRGMVSKNKVGNHSMNLITAVATYRENDDTNTRPIIFVCHSLGGLVCKDALIASRQRPESHLQNIFLCTRGIAFLGTPHTGAGLAEWASKLARSIGLLKQTNAQIVAVLETDSEVLARIQDNFHTMIRSREQHGLPPIWITCFYEELPLAGVGIVVPHHSAVIPGYTPIGIHKHHRDMTRFESDDDPGFLAIIGELRRWIKKLTIPTIPTAAYILEPPHEDRVKKAAVQIEDERRTTIIPIEQEYRSRHVRKPELAANILQQRKPKSIGHFVARQDVQEELKRWLLSDSSPRPVVLCGIGGSGKTQLAIQCCQEAEESGFLATLWVDASSPMSVEQSYNVIAKAIQKDFADEDDIQTTISLVHDTLRSWPQPWLMVFDNYDNPKAFQKRSIREFMPESKNGHVLLTSRHTGLEHSGNQISVSSMSKSESLDLLLLRSPSDPDEETEGLMVADLLGHLALALDQAGAYIRARKLPLKEFRSHYEKRKDIIFREVPDDWEYRDQSGPLSVFTTWEMSFGLISGDEKTSTWKENFLTLAGFFDPKSISERYFHAYCDAAGVEWMNLFRVDGKWDSYEFGDVLAELHKLSLIQLPDQELGERSFTIHPIVCDWLVHRRGKAKRRQMTMELIYAIEVFLKSSDEKDLPLEVNQETILHLDCCIRHEKAFFEDSRTGLRALPKIASLFARFYRKQGRYSDAEQLFLQALAENERALGRRHPDTLGTIESLATICRKQGNYNVAEELFKRALAERERRTASVLGIKSPEANVSSDQGPRPDLVDTLRTTQKLANVYSDQGRYPEAEHLLERALKGMEENLGPKHLETLSAGQNLANVYRKRGRYKDAELLYQSALEAKEKKLGLEHPDTLGTVENLANIYRKLRRYSEAERMFERSVSSKEKKLGPEHPEALRALQNLANVYSDQEQYDRAELLYQQALQGNEKLLGLEHPDTLRTVENLANLYSKASSKASELNLRTSLPSSSTSESCDPNIKSYNLAQQLLKRALEGNKKKRGLDHPDTLGTMDNLAIVYYRHKEYKKAERLLKQALSGKEKKLGKLHPETLGTVKILGNVHYKLGRYDEAELEYKRVLDAKEILEDPDILGMTQNLANIYRKQGWPDKAEQLVLSLQPAIPEAQSGRAKETPSPMDASAEKNFDLLIDSTNQLPRGRLFLSAFQGRGLRPSGKPYVICQFQGATYISGGPKITDETEEIGGGSWNTTTTRQLEAALDGVDNNDLAMPIPTSRSNRESQSSDPRSHRTEQKAIKWIVNPKWDWDISFDVFGDDTEIDVQVYDLSDHDRTFLGLVRFRPDLTKLVPYDERHSLGSRGDEETPSVTGEIHLGIHFQKTEQKNCGPEDVQILRLIGKGNHGQVYEIHKKDTKCLYAMKVWQKKIIGRALHQSRQSEDSWHLRAQIPNPMFIAEIKFSFQTATDLYIVTDYSLGGELFWFLRKEVRFSEERTKFYVAEIILALQHLHNHNILNVDLRPETILLDAIGHITLCDFGLSKRHKLLTKDMKTESFCGVTQYLAPEVLLDEDAFTGIADFWTLGVLIFEMSCGWSPFYAEDRQRMYKNITSAKVTFPRDILNFELRNFIRGLLNRNPNHRLGATDGTEELKRHDFLAGTNWDALAKKLVTPPFIPLLVAKTYYGSGFAYGLDSLKSRAGVTTSTPFSPGMQANFKGFTFVDEASLADHAQSHGFYDNEKMDKKEERDCDWYDPFDPPY